jgi:hypothetical protein
MDASQITKLLQIQNTRYINRNKPVDSSTLIWKNQIQSSKYIKSVKTCEGEQNWNVPTNPCCADQEPVNNGVQNTGTYSFGGSGRTTSLQTGSSQQFLNVLSGAAGSAAEVYSSERILLQKAGKESCGVPGTNPAPENSYVVLPACYCVDTNGPTGNSSAILSNPSVPGNSLLTGNPNNLPINNQTNPYLPPFDTYYRFKNPSALNTGPIQDQNQKHFVKECHTRFPNANNGETVLAKPCDNTLYLNPTTKAFETNPYFVQGTTNTQIPPTCDGCVLQP